MANFSEEQIQNAFALPVNEVLANLGREVFPPHRGALPPPFSEWLAVAHRFLEKNRATLCEAIANQAVLRDYMNAGQSYKLSQIVGIITDLIMLKCSIPSAGAFWASIALMQLGLEQFCKECKQNQGT